MGPDWFSSAEAWSGSVSCAESWSWAAGVVIVSFARAFGRVLRWGGCCVDWTSGELGSVRGKLVPRYHALAM